MKRRQAVLELGFRVSLGVAFSGTTSLLLPESAQAQAAEARTPGATSTPAATADPNPGARLQATRAQVSEDAEGRRFVLLDRRVELDLGRHQLEASAALVRLTPAGPAGVYDFAAVLLDARSRRVEGPADVPVPELLVTAEQVGRVALEASLIEPGTRAMSPTQRAVFERGLARLQRAGLAPGETPDASAGPGPAPAPAAAAAALREARRASIASRVAETTAARAPRPAEMLVRNAEAATARRPRPTPVLPQRGTVSYEAAVATVQQLDDGRAVATLQGGMRGPVRVLFEDAESGRVVGMEAQNVVVFLRNGDDGRQEGGGGFEAGRVGGVYLEGGAVVGDGAYTVRAPRAFYDLARDRAILLEAVAYTFDRDRRVPLYLRAQVLEQLSASEFEAREAVFTTSEFAEPHLAVAADRLHVERRETPDGAPGLAFEAEGTRVRVGGVPVFYLPYAAGSGSDVPLRSVRLGYRSDQGAVVRTRWDLFGLLGREEPDGVDADLELDWRGRHGAAVGADITGGRGQRRWGLEGYVVLHDQGDDDLGQRNDLERDGETRGYARGRFRDTFDNGWSVAVRGAYVDDPAFLETFAPSLAFEARELNTTAVLSRPRGDTLTYAAFDTNLNAFIGPLAPLQTPGFVTERLPELGYRRTGTPLFRSEADGSGLLTWTSDNTASLLRARFGDDAPEDRGFNDTRALDVFGVPAGVSFADAADAAGLPDDTRLRLDSRQELAVPIDLGGAASVTPYLVGRATAYDDDFGDAGGTDQQTRLWGGAGVRAWARLMRTDTGVRSQTLDVSGLRHIVEPNAEVLFASADVDSGDLFQYDTGVEGVAEGGFVKLGMTQTLQTRRGPAAARRTVDWILWDTYVVLRSGDADSESQPEARTTFGRYFNRGTPLPRYVASRPELSRGGDHAFTELRWLVTDALGLAAEATYDFEADTLAQWRAGARLDHGPRLSSVLSFEAIDAVDSELLTYGLNYEMTRKYRLQFSQTLDFSGNQRRTLTLGLQRRLPRMRLVATAAFDQLNDEQSFGLTLIPDGFGGGGLGTGLVD